MLDKYSDALSMQNIRSPSNQQLLEEQPIKPLLRLGPNVGRSFHVDAGRGIDVARAFRQLDSACRKNKVRTDFANQRFHERPGLKRKRIRYEGKIRGFKARFTKVVQMVQRMTKSGW
jgi:small subunit ribosomal protein MRP21